jgi:hypothetical protein
MKSISALVFLFAIATAIFVPSKNEAKTNYFYNDTYQHVTTPSVVTAEISSVEVLELGYFTCDHVGCLISLDISTEFLGKPNQVLVPKANVTGNKWKHVKPPSLSLQKANFLRSNYNVTYLAPISWYSC